MVCLVNFLLSRHPAVRAVERQGNFGFQDVLLLLRAHHNHLIVWKLIYRVKKIDVDLLTAFYMDAWPGAGQYVVRQAKI
jgi:hypothetical protein